MKQNYRSSLSFIQAAQLKNLLSLRLFTAYSASWEEACEFYNFSELCDSGKFPESRELPFLGILFSLLEVATQHTDLDLTSKGQGSRPNLFNKVKFFSY